MNRPVFSDWRSRNVRGLWIPRTVDRSRVRGISADGRDTRRGRSALSRASSPHSRPCTPHPPAPRHASLSRLLSRPLSHGHSSHTTISLPTKRLDNISGTARKVNNWSMSLKLPPVMYACTLWFMEAIKYWVLVAASKQLNQIVINKHRYPMRGSNPSSNWRQTRHVAARLIRHSWAIPRDTLLVV